MIGLTSTLMITWEVITSSVDTLSYATQPQEADDRHCVQDLIQCIRKWWPGGIDLWIFIRLVRGDTSSSGHGRDGFNVRFEYAEFHVFLLFFRVAMSQPTQDLDKLPLPSARPLFFW